MLISLPHQAKISTLNFNSVLAEGFTTWKIYCLKCQGNMRLQWGKITTKKR